MIIDPSVFKKFWSQFRRENIYKFRIFGRNWVGSFICHQYSYLCSAKKMDITFLGAARTFKKSYVNYEGIISQIKSCSCKLFLSYQLDPLDGMMGFLNGIRSTSKLSLWKIDIRTTQSKELHSENHIWLIFAIRKIFSKNLTLLVWSVTEKTTTIISSILKVVPSIFWTPTLVVCTIRPNLSANARCIALTSLPESKSTDIRGITESSWITPTGKAIRY